MAEGLEIPGDEYLINYLLIKVIIVGSDTFGSPIFHEGLQN